MSQSESSINQYSGDTSSQPLASRPTRVPAPHTCCTWPPLDTISIFIKPVLDGYYFVPNLMPHSCCCKEWKVLILTRRILPQYFYLKECRMSLILNEMYAINFLYQFRTITISMSINLKREKIIFLWILITW